MAPTAAEENILFIPLSASSLDRRLSRQVIFLGEAGPVRLLQLFIGCGHEDASSIEAADISKSPSTMRVPVTADPRDICTGTRERTDTRNRNHRRIYYCDSPYSPRVRRRAKGVAGPSAAGTRPPSHLKALGTRGPGAANGWFPGAAAIPMEFLRRGCGRARAPEVSSVVALT